EPGDTPLEKKQLLSEKEYRSYYDKYGKSFKAQMGAEAIRKLLQDIDLDKEVEALREELKTAQGQRRTRAIKRLEVLEAFRHSGFKRLVPPCHQPQQPSETVARSWSSEHYRAK